MSPRVRSSVLLGALAALALLAGCSDALPPPETTKRPVVTPLRSLHAVRFEDGETEPSSAESARLRGFIDRVARGPGDLVMVELPADPDPASLPARRAAELVESLRAEGLQVGLFESAEPAPRRVRVLVERIAVNAPAGCPDWRLPGSYSSFVNGTGSNHGCATANNLSVMLARPRDAAKGQTMGPARGERHALGVGFYDLGGRPELPATGTRGSTGSGGVGGSD